MIETAMIGGGGHASSCISLAKEVFGEPIYVSTYFSLGKSSRDEFKNSHFVSNLSDFQKRVSKLPLINGVGLASSLEIRNRLFVALVNSGIGFPNLISRSSVVWSDLTGSLGIQIFPGSFIGTGVRLGDNVCVGSHAVLEHDVNVGDNVMVAPGVKVLGGAQISEGVFIGSGAIVLPGIKIGEMATIGAGAVVTKDVFPRVTVVGLPAKKVFREN